MRKENKMNIVSHKLNNLGSVQNPKNCMNFNEFLQILIHYQYVYIIHTYIKVISEISMHQRQPVPYVIETYQLKYQKYKKL